MNYVDAEKWYAYLDWIIVFIEFDRESANGLWDHSLMLDYSKCVFTYSQNFVEIEKFNRQKHV